MPIMNYAIPPILQLESTTACNLNCPFCLRESFCSSEEFIPFEAFKKIIDSSNNRYLTLHGWGEPLLHPELPAMIRYASDKKISVNFTTNATLLPGKTTELLDSGLEAIAFSLPDTKMFTARIEQNIAGFIEEKNAKSQKNPKTYINIALMPENLDCVGEMLRMADRTGVDTINFERSFPWTEELHDKEKAIIPRIKITARELGCDVKLPPDHANPCHLFRYTLFVRWNGDVAPCCYRPDITLGNMLKDNIVKIMVNRAQFAKRMSRDPVCRICRV